MNFSREHIRDYYLRDTNVENIFINEYMTQAPGDYVKVYLFALMYADYDMLMSNDTIAKQLGMADEDVLKAWSYWESMGIIKKHYEKPSDKFRYEVEFLNLKELVYGKKTKSKKTESGVPDNLKELMDNDEIKNMYSEIERIKARPFEGKEPGEIMSWITGYNATPEIIVYAYAYCKKNKNNSNYKYVGAVVKEWVNNGFKTIDQIDSFLDETDNRHHQYKRVMRSLGFMRNATEEEKRIMDTWFDDMNFGIDKVLDACKKTSGISNPNINYINTVLKGWNSGEKKTSSRPGKIEEDKPNQIGSVMKYYDELRVENESLADSRRQEVYTKIPRVSEIEEELREVGFQISRVMLSGVNDKTGKIDVLNKRLDKLNQEKAFLMTENNFKIDYMNIVYSCPLCRDTGTQDTGDRCSCFAEKLEEIQKRV